MKKIHIDSYDLAFPLLLVAVDWGCQGSLPWATCATYTSDGLPYVKPLSFCILTSDL